MRSIDIDSQEWSHLRHELQTGTCAAGFYVITGPSGAVSTGVRAVIEDTPSQGHQLLYFLCSGSGMFNVPCYHSMVDTQGAREFPNAFHVMSNYYVMNTREQAVYAPAFAASQIERIAMHGEQPPQLILIECLTRPTQSELLFIQLVLTSTVRRVVPLLIFVHQANYTSDPHQSDTAIDASLLVLHMCGGRIRDTDWTAISRENAFRGHQMVTQMVTPRQIGAATWFCYANRGVAEAAGRSIGRAEQARVQQIATKILTALPCGTEYPVLAIASKASRIDVMLSRYSRGAVRSSMSQPKILVAYFRNLRRAARATGETALASVATVNYAAALLYAYRRSAPLLYRALGKLEITEIDERALALLWYELGQRFAKADDSRVWGLASGCFTKSLEHIDKVPQLGRAESASRRAAVANGEALIAYKRGQRDTACRIEAAALAGLTEGDAQSYILDQRALLRSNLGDVHLRMFHDVDGAIAQYQIAYQQSVAGRGHVGPKLADALMRAGRHEEAARVLEDLLVEMKQSDVASELAQTMVGLKVWLALAQAYLGFGSRRNAAACYWHILRQPERLTPVVLKGIAHNLRHCRPDMPAYLQARIDRIVSEQEGTMAGVTRVQEVLSRM